MRKFRTRSPCKELDGLPFDMDDTATPLDIQEAALQAIRSRNTMFQARLRRILLV
jgi:hypothetical protein